MVKRRFLTGFVIVLVFMLPAGRCLADVSAQLAEAKAYAQQHEYEQAEAIYRQVAADNPGTDAGLAAQEKLTILYVRQEKLADAEASYQQLIAGYSGNGGIAKAVDHVGDAYREARKYDKALAVYQHVVDNWAQAEHAVGSQVNIAKLNIRLGKESAADAAVEKLIAVFAANERIANEVDEVADEYHEYDQEDKALTLYKRVVETWPNAREAMQSQASVAKLYLELGDDPNAQAATDELIARFGGREDAGDSVHDVAYTYHHQVRDYGKARELYQWVVQNHPRDSKAIRAQMGIAKTYIVIGDDPNAAAAIDKLIADYSQDQGIAKALDHLADNYRKVGQYEKARQLYELVVARWPDADYARNSQMGIVKAIIEANIARGDDEVVEAEIENLVADFNDNEGLTKALFQMGEKYHRQASVCQNRGSQAEARQNFAKAIAIWDKIIQLPASNKTCDAYYFSADCYRHLDEYQKAIEYYEKVVRDWPDWRHADTAQFRIARCYRKLQEQGRMATTDAIVLMRDACQKAIANYPDSAPAKGAAALLEHVEFLESITKDQGDNK